MNNDKSQDKQGESFANALKQRETAQKNRGASFKEMFRAKTAMLFKPGTVTYERKKDEKKPEPSLDRKDFTDRIIHTENRGSSGDLYKVVGVSGDLGKYQASPATIKDWSESWLGKKYSTDEFLNDPKAQDKFFQNFLDVAERLKLTPQQAAVTWHKGWGKLGTGKPREERDKEFFEYLEKEMESDYAKKYLENFNSYKVE